MNNLSTLDRDSMEPVVKIFDALNQAADADQANVSISPLPTVPTGGGAPVAGAQSLSVYGNVTLNYGGMGTVDERNAYVVEMVPQGENRIIENGTYWFDEQWYYPFKSTGHMNLSVINGTVSMEYRNVTFNPEISDDTFDFDILANATVENGSAASNVSSESFDSREALSNAADTELPNLDIPDDYRFETGNLIDNGSIESISLRYTNGIESLMVSVRPSRIDGGSDLGETIEINGHNATIASIRGGHTLTLRCGERTYGVTGSEPREAIIDIAESIDC